MNSSPSDSTFICSLKHAVFDRHLKWPTHCTAVSASIVDLHLTEVQHL